MRLVLLVVAFVFTISAPAQDDDVLAARVASVLDGDTIEVQVESGPVRVREELSTGELVATVYVQYQARLAGRGLWSLAKPVEPWKWVRAVLGDQIF